MFIPNSSTVEQRAVNSHVVGSNPASGAIRKSESRSAEEQTQVKAKEIKTNPAQLPVRPLQRFRSLRQL